jgi:threonine dehydrogenase-like Zn-dependent dehydrogenase
VGLDRAAYATVGAIALQGVRLARPQLGEVGVVVGLGLIGQLAVQLLRAAGCRVLGIDTDAARAAQALEQGAEWSCGPDAVPESWKDAATAGYGADFAVVAASAASSAPIARARRSPWRPICAGRRGGSRSSARCRWISNAGPSTTRSSSSS